MRRRALTGSVAVFVVEVIFLLVVLALLPASVRERSQGDYVTYYRPVADRILAGDGLTVGPGRGRPAVRYPPGQPLVIAGVLRVSRALHLGDDAGQRLATALLMGLAAAFVYSIARRLASARAAVIGTTLWMVFPPTVFLATRLNSEVTFMPLAYGAVWGALLMAGATGRRRLLLAAAVGVALGLALLVRPAGLAFVVPLLLFALLRRSWPARQRLAAAGAMLAALVVVLAPWTAWASTRGDGFVALSTGGAPSVLDGLTIGPLANEPGRAWVPPASVAAMRDVVARESSQPGRSVEGLVLSVARDHPVGFAELVGVKALRSWFGTESQRDELWVGLLQLPFVVLIGWGALLALRRARRPSLADGDRHAARTAALLLLAILVAAWALTIAVLSIAAYMAPALGLALALAGIGPAQLTHARRRKA